MVSSAASTVDQYLASLPPDRRAAIARVRDVVNAALPRGYEETLQYGMISWIVPRSRLAETYNGQALALASLGAQKQHMALYLMSVYGDAKLGTWFRSAYQASGKKLDMGKACIRFKTLDALPLDVIGQAISKVPVDTYVAVYEASRAKTVKPKPVARRSATPAQRSRTPAKTKPAKTKPIKSAVNRTAKPTRAKPAKPTATRTTKSTAKKAANPAERTRAPRRDS